MKIYGFSDTDIQRGELHATNVGAEMLHFEGEAENMTGWEFASTRFAEARDRLIQSMQTEEVDPELVDQVRSLKASYIPVEDYGA